MLAAHEQLLDKTRIAHYTKLLRTARDVRPLNETSQSRSPFYGDLHPLPHETESSCDDHVPVATVHPVSQLHPITHLHYHTRRVQCSRHDSKADNPPPFAPIHGAALTATL